MESIIKEDINLHELKEDLLYEEDTGNFFWLRPAQGRHMGKPIGYNSTTAYNNITYNGVVIRSHVLAWFYMTGEWPPIDKIVDHKDGNSRNNKWNNLQLLTHIEKAIKQKQRQSNLSGTKVSTKEPEPKIQRARFSSKNVSKAVETFLQNKE